MTLKTINFTLALDFMMLPYHIVLGNITEKSFNCFVGKVLKFLFLPLVHPFPSNHFEGTARHGRTIGKHCNKKHDPYIVTRRETLEQSVCKGMKCHSLLVYSLFSLALLFPGRPWGFLSFSTTSVSGSDALFKFYLKLETKTSFDIY